MNTTQYDTQLQSRDDYSTLINYLITQGADPAIALHHPALVCDMRELLQHTNADVSIGNYHILRRACEIGNLDIVKYLVEEYGVDVNADNNHALETAYINNHHDIVEYMVQCGSDTATLNILIELDSFTG